MNKLLITGASSFSANHLAEIFLQSSADEFHLIGTSRSHSLTSRWSAYYRGDIADKDFANHLIQTTSPTHIIHLAGSSNPEEPEELFRVNLQGTWNLLSACCNLAKPPRIVLVGSAAGFGDMESGEIALAGTRPSSPNSLYGLVREQALEIGSFFKTNYELPIVRCRTFNLIGPGLPEKYAPTAITKRLLGADTPTLASFEIANGDHVRDFLDIRDACRAWKSILLHGSIERIYSVGSGRPCTIRELTETILSCLGVQVVIEETPNLDHPNRSQITRSLADIRDLISDVRWNPGIQLRESVMDMIVHLKQTEYHSTDSN